jgi:uncharacterized membrane protein YhaH (DUF805 family)
MRSVKIADRNLMRHHTAESLAGKPYIIAAGLTAVILFNATGLAAPLFLVTAIIVLIPWLMWGFAIHTGRLHDRGKSAWWRVVFYVVPAGLG